jgi:hypothetical protein
MGAIAAFAERGARVRHDDLPAAAVEATGEQRIMIS